MRWLVGLVVAACGRFEFANVPDGGGATDALDGTCWPAWLAGTIRFTPPSRLVELDFGDALGNPMFSADGLELIYDRIGAGYDLWSAHRTARGMPWQGAMSLAAINSSSDEGRATIANGFLVWSSMRNGNTALWTATRTNTTTFTVPAMTYVGAINTAQSNPIDPELSADGLHLYTAPAAGAEQHITVASRESTTAPFGTPVTISELSISMSVGDPVLSPDERVVALSSGVGTNANDLYYAVRTSTTQPFGAPRLIPDVNMSDVDEHDIDIARDGCELVFFSNRDGNLGALYAAFAR